MKHKHYDCIVAWASGESDIEVSADGKIWSYVNNPSWAEDMMYRIVKEPVVKVKYFELYTDCVAENGKFINAYYEFTPDLEKWDLKITYHDDVAVKVELPS